MSYFATMSAFNSRSRFFENVRVEVFPGVKTNGVAPPPFLIAHGMAEHAGWKRLNVSGRVHRYAPCHTSVHIGAPELLHVYAPLRSLRCYPG